MGPRCPGCPGVFALSRSWCVLGRPGCLGVIGLSNVLGRPRAPRTPQDLTLDRCLGVSPDTPDAPGQRISHCTMPVAVLALVEDIANARRTNPRDFSDDPRGSPDNPDGSPDNPRDSQTVCGRPLSVTL